MKKLTHAQIGLLMLVKSGYSQGIEGKLANVANTLQEMDLISVNNGIYKITINGDIVSKAIIGQANRICRQKYSDIL